MIMKISRNLAFLLFISLFITSCADITPADSFTLSLPDEVDFGDVEVHNKSRVDYLEFSIDSGETLLVSITNTKELLNNDFVLVEKSTTCDISRVVAEGVVVFNDGCIIAFQFVPRSIGAKDTRVNTQEGITIMLKGRGIESIQ